MSRILLPLSACFFAASALLACSTHVARVPVSGPAKPALPFPVFDAAVADVDEHRVGAAIHVGGRQHALVLHSDAALPDAGAPAETPTTSPVQDDSESLQFDELDQVTHLDTR